MTTKKIAETYNDRSGLDPNYWPSSDAMKAALSIVDGCIRLVEQFPQQPEEIEEVYTYFRHMGLKRVLKEPDRYSAKPYWDYDLRDFTAFRIHVAFRSLWSSKIDESRPPFDLHELGVLREKIKSEIENASTNGFQLISFKTVLKRRKSDITDNEV